MFEDQLAACGRATIKVKLNKIPFNSLRFEMVAGTDGQSIDGNFYYIHYRELRNKSSRPSGRS